MRPLPAVLSILATLCISCSSLKPSPTATPVPPTSTATLLTAATPAAPTPLPSVDCPDLAEIPTAVCEFSLEIERLAVAGDVDAFAALMEEVEFECPDPNATGLSGPTPLCDGAPEGEHRFGYRLANDVVGFAYSLAQLPSWPLFRTPGPSVTDDFGDGGLALFTIGCPVDPSASCEDRFIVVISAHRPDETRVIHFAFVRRLPDDGFQVTQLRAIGLPPIGRAEWLTGGSPPEGWGELSEVAYLPVR